MGMAHFTSGKAGYSMYETTPGVAIVDIPTKALRQILEAEDKYRASEEVRNLLFYSLVL
jgi:hypothetical protein